MRLALNYAIDKQAFAKVVFSGFSDPMDSPMPQGLGFYQKQGSYPYDPAKAKALLAEAGYPNGFEARSLVASRRLPSVACSSCSSSLPRSA